jgi:hypothetical protein
MEATAPRVVGWMVAGGVAVLAGWLLWPRSSHVALRGLAASVIRDVAATIATPRQGAQLERAARDQLAALRRGFVVAQRRPSGATRRDRALAELATELDRALTFAASAAATNSSAAKSEASTLRSAVVRALQASAALLERSTDTPTSSRWSQPATRTARRWTAGWPSNSAGMTSETVLDELVTAHPLRLMFMMALAIAQNTEVVAGSTTVMRVDLATPLAPGQTTTFDAAWHFNVPEHGADRMGREGALFELAQWYPRVCVYDDLRGTNAAVKFLGLGVIASLFYVMSGRIEALAVPFVGVSGRVPWLWWVVLPLLVVLAAYTPAAVNFVVGQVAFSVLVVVLFNILAPTDWQIGLVRVEDAALGVGISAIVGLLLWPRGAGVSFARLADLYDAAASSLSFSFRRMLTDTNEPDQEVSSSHRLARTEAIRAQEVFEQFLSERTRQASGVDVWAMLLSSGKGFLLIGDVLDWLFEHGYAAAQAGAPAGTLTTVAGSAIAHSVRLAEEMRSGHRLRVAGFPDTSGSCAAQLASYPAEAV